MNTCIYSAVIGANGQDGFLMTRYLLKKNIKTLAIIRNNNEKLVKIQNSNLKILKLNEFNTANLKKIKKYKIDNFYFFAGYSKIPTNKLEKIICQKLNYQILEKFLIFFSKYYKNSKLLYLSSAEIFGENQNYKKNEKSKMKGDNYYGECKIKSHKLIEMYRKMKLFISIAICYNHESLYSPKTHLVPTIIKKLNNSQNNVKFYNVNEYKNLSHVYDFLPIFYKILKLKKPTNLVFANNENYRIKDLIKILVNHLNVKKNLKYVTKLSKRSRKASNIKMKNMLNYKPVFTTKKLLIRMCSYYKKGYYI